MSELKLDKPRAADTARARCWGRSSIHTARAAASDGTHGFSAASPSVSEGTPKAGGPFAARSGPEGRAEAERTAERSGDHDSSPDATRVAGNESVAASLTSNAQPPSLSAVSSEPK